MKLKYIRTLVREMLQEDMAADKAAQDAEKIAVDKQIVALQKRKSEMGKTSLTEDDLEEMARAPKGYSLVDPDMDSAPYAKKISSIPLSTIIEFIRENPGVDVKSIQNEFNFIRPQIPNAIIKGMLDSGIITKLGGGEEITPGEESTTRQADPDDMIVGGGGEDPLAMYFDGEENPGGEEDFNDSEEPTIDADEPIDVPDSQKKISDEDYEKWMKYDDLVNRLASTKSNMIKLKRSKGSSPGDISSTPSTELLRLRDLKSSLEGRIAELVASSEYLQRKEAGATGGSENHEYKTKYKPKEPVENEDDGDEVNNEPSINEWDLRKMKYYAGIIK